MWRHFSQFAQRCVTYRLAERYRNFGDSMPESEDVSANRITIELDYAPRVTYALQQNDVPVIRELRLHNRGASDLSDLRVVVNTTSELAKPLELKLLHLTAGDTRRFIQIDLQLDSAQLANLVERERTDLRVTVFSGEQVLATASFPLEVLAFNEWPGLVVLPEIIAAFVCPNHPAIESQLETLRGRLRSWTNDGSLNGYQSGSRDRCFKMVAATYEAMKAIGIGYINPPASFEQGGQKIRTPDQVLDGPKLGTCLDLTVVAASLIEQMGLHPLIILIKGHSFVGAWLHDTTFSEPTVDDASRIANRVALSEIVIFETTALVEGKDVPFDAAVSMAIKSLEADTFQAAVDVSAARRARILPLPPRIKSGNGFVVVQHQPSVNAAGTDGGSIPVLNEESLSKTAAAKMAKRLVVDLPEEALQRLDRWKRKLLDLSLRNPLLNFRLEGKRAIGLLVTDVATLEDRLYQGQVFQLMPRSGAINDDGMRDLTLETQRSGRDVPHEILQKEFDRNLIRIDVATGFDARMVELFRDARTAIEETGSNTLYLTLGMLKWYETEKSEQARYAPLILMPVRIERPSPGQFRLLASEDEVRVNITLIEKLRQDYQLKANHLSELEEDDNGVNVPAMLRGFREVIKDMSRWEVKDQAFIGHFSFSKFVLWTDLDQRLQQVASNATVKYILTRAAQGNEFSDFPSESSIDRLPPEEVALCPLNADSSQLAAIEAAIKGKTFVLQGPPGTGKSQTITNMIARAAASGKRVLFVAEKLAALSVVRSRLQQIGMGPYVLELHSNKVGKKEVLEQLRSSIEAPAPSNLSNWEEEVETLSALRHKLNDYVRALHTPRASGETVYQVISRVNALDGAPAVECKFEQILSTTAQQLRGYRQAISDAAGAARALGGVEKHPLQGIRCTQWRLDLGDRARKAIEPALEIVGVMRSAFADWLVHLGFTAEEIPTLKINEFAPLYQLSKALLQREHASQETLNPERGEQFCKSVSAVTSVGRERDGIHAQLASQYTAAFFDAQHQEWIARIQSVRSTNPLFRWVKSRSLSKDASAFATGGKKIALDHFSRDCVAAKRLRELSAQLTTSLGKDAAPGVTDWADIDAEALWAQGVVSLLQKYIGGTSTPQRLRVAIASLYAKDGMRAGAAPRDAAESFVDVIRTFQQCLTELEKTLSASTGELTGRNRSSALDSFESTLSRWRTHLDALPEWSAWQSVIQNPDAKLLQPFFFAMERGEVKAASLKGAFELAFARAWLGAVMASEPVLQRFTYESRTRLIQDFKEVDKRVMKLSQQVMAKTLAAQRPSQHLQSANATSELGLLRRQLQLQRNHKAVRRLVKELPTVLPKLKPIWLMSPLSVAQFLDPTTPPFDLVVFDEASQIPVWDAIGALARANKAVVVGDSKQLPPTNFFQRQEEEAPDDDEMQVEELESILDECIAASIPELKLRWHYRSKHESLIAFSNHQYYENNLHTFPSSEESTNRIGVSMRHLPDATYDRGGSRTNVVEGQAIVAELMLRLAEGGSKSIGIVTFSMAQQRLIEDLIDKEIAKRPDLKRYFDSKEPDYVFVKNLENVQGDERDVIFFSICYGRTASGKITAGFGPLNRDGGERRLNVAITRARVQVLVFTSVKSEQINLSQSRSRGLADLKHFLDYAERGPSALVEMLTLQPADHFDSPFEEEVCHCLRDRGWSVETQVGCSGYRIDMAVRDPDRPGRFLIGIECDGFSYHSAASARDRDRIREEVLNGLGWSLHRVWSTDWLQNRQKAMERMIAAIELARTRVAEAVIEAVPAVDTSATAITVAEVQTPQYSGLKTVDLPAAGTGPAIPANTDGTEQPASSLPGEVVYVRHSFDGVHRDSAQFYVFQSNAQLRLDIQAVVATESPIHRDELYDRVARAWGLQKVTKRVEDRLDELCRQLVLKTMDGFLRSDAALPQDRFRVPPVGSQRSLETVSPEEIRAAIGAVLATQGTLPASELEREVARCFGFSRARESTRALIRKHLPTGEPGAAAIS